MIPAHRTQNWVIRKPSASGRRGVVVSQSGDAAAAGVAILDAGGTAAYAAVATALALAASEPWNSGLGGIGFALIHMSGQPRATVIDFGPRAPANLTPDRFHLTGRTGADLFAWPEVEGDANVHGPLSFVIPSAVSGYRHLHEQYGRLPLAEVAAPAIALARRGLPQDWFTTLKVGSAASILRRYAESARIYLPDGLPPMAPAQGVPRFMALGHLADTLERLATAGWADFYTGDLAASLLHDVAAMGGVLDAADLAGCIASAGPAQEIAWPTRRRPAAVLQVAPGLTAGPTLADIVARLPPADAPDANWFTALAAILRGAYARRLAGDAPEPVGAESCTSHLTVCDADGTMVSMTTTLLSSMGSRVVLPGTGVLMNNGVMWFDPRPGMPNAIAPGARPLCNMCPVILRDGDHPVLAAGASGGRRIVAAVTQMLAFTHGFGMDPATAAHHPRIDVSGSDTVTADDRLGADVLDALRATGPVDVVEHVVLPVNFACPNLIAIEDGVRTGISDVMSPWSAALAQPERPPSP